MRQEKIVLELIKKKYECFFLCMQKVVCVRQNFSMGIMWTHGCKVVLKFTSIFISLNYSFRIISSCIIFMHHFTHCVKQPTFLKFSNHVTTIQFSAILNSAYLALIIAPFYLVLWKLIDLESWTKKKREEEPKSRKRLVNDSLNSTFLGDFTHPFERAFSWLLELSLLLASSSNIQVLANFLLIKIFFWSTWDLMITMTFYQVWASSNGKFYCYFVVTIIWLW